MPANQLAMEDMTAATERTAGRKAIRFSSEEVAALLAAARKRLQYDPETGEVWSVVGRKRRKLVPNKHGYQEITLLGRKFQLHRICWLLAYGYWPEGDVDHRNHDRTDNRKANLRIGGYTGNARNKVISKRNSVGFKGVRLTATSRLFFAAITVDRKKIELGSFPTAEAAARAYDAKARELHGEFACTNEDLGLYEKRAA